MRSVGAQVGLRTLAAMVALLGAVAALPPGLGSNPASATEVVVPARVVVVSLPALGWDDVTPTSTPTLAALADRGATGALSPKTIRRTTPADAYATIGAGTRATAPAGAGSSGRGVDDPLPAGITAGEQARADGHDPGGAAVVVLDVDAVAAANAGQHRGAQVGALARALGQHGWSTAVVANHDGPDGVDRTAALAVASPTGRIDHGSVATSLVSGGPGDLRTDRAALARAVADLPARRTVAVVEVGDVAWVDAAGAGPAARRAATKRADAAVAAVVAESGPDDLLVVVAPTAPAVRDQPTPFVLAGPGVAAGLATSATTRRAGYVTLPDVSATILDRVGARVPLSMEGTPITVSSRSTSGAHRLAHLRDAIAETRFVDRSAGIFLVTLPIVFASWSLLALLAAVLPLGRFARPARTFVRWMGLAIAVVPTLTFLVGGFTVGSWGQPRWSGVVWSLAALLGAGALLLGPSGRAPVVVAALAWAVPVVDLLTGARLQFDTPLGNSPTVAGRFAGIGNIAFGLLAAATVVLAVATWQAVDQRRPGRPALVAAAVVFAVAIAVDGAPGLGSDVGGVLTLVPVAAVTLWLLAGRRVSWARLAGAGAATVAVLGGLTAVDLTRPEASQTHLGRLARQAVDGDGGAEVVRRKADAALSSFYRSSLVWIVICTILLAVLLWALARPAVQRLAERPLARPLLVASALLAVVGAASNDSGVMVPAMMATVLVPAAVHLMLAPDGPLSAPRPSRPGLAEYEAEGGSAPERR